MSATPTLDELGFTLARNDLTAYTIARNPRYRPSNVHRAIARAYNRVLRGDCKRLLVFAPPRHGKSELGSRSLPAAFLGHHPDKEVMHISYAGTFAEEFGRTVRNQLASPMYSHIFPGVSLADDSKAVDRFNTNHGGAYYAVGLDGPVVGRGAHLLLLDDFIRERADALSEAKRRKRLSWFQSAAYPRLMDDAAIVVTITRWSEEDLDAWLISELQDEGWEVVILRAIAEEDDILGREVGEALWPERYPIERLLQIKKAIGSFEFEAQYQQRPQPLDGALWQKPWWKRHPAGALPEPISAYYLSWDTGWRDTVEAADSAWVLAGIGRTASYIIDWESKGYEFPALKRRVKEVAQQFRHLKLAGILIENKASGIALLQDLKIESGAPFIGVEPDEKKQVRWIRNLPCVEAGRWSVPHGPKGDAFIDRMARVGSSSVKVDLADAFSQLSDEIRGKWIFMDPERELDATLKKRPTLAQLNRPTGQ